ncbi:MAG: SDR family NAD(P)-dependent oxidoreductase [bacterium]|nr:SDR family NAD(P)-dependent oxidoreductase [bacterium]
MKSFEGRVAVVTGGASGIGKGIANQLAAQGMKLVLADVERAPLDEAVADFTAKGFEAIGVECDVSKPESVEALAGRTLDAYGAVHVLCNNAGVAGSGGSTSWEQPLGEWEWVMGVNLWGVVHGVRSFLPLMIEQGDEGHVVNTASIAGLVQGSGIYGVTKHAVVALSESLFNELGNRDSKIKVSVLCPGWVNTRILESERNRPEAPRPAPSEETEQLALMRKIVEGMLAKGLDPIEVGSIVVDAIRNESFYVQTHPHWMNMIESRMQNIVEGKDPIGVPPPGMEDLKLPTSD